MVYKGKNIVHTEQHIETIDYFKIPEDTLKTILKRAIDKMLSDVLYCNNSETYLIYSKEFNQGVLVEFTSDLDKYISLKLILPPGKYLKSINGMDSLYDDNSLPGSEDVKTYLVNLFFSDDTFEIYPKTKIHRPKTIIVDEDSGGINDEGSYFDVEIVEKYGMKFITVDGKIYEIVDIEVLEVE